MPGTPLEELRALAAEVAEQVRWTAAVGGAEVPDLAARGADSRAPETAGRPPPTQARPSAPALPTPPTAPGENPGEALLRQLRGGPRSGPVRAAAPTPSPAAAAPAMPAPAEDAPAAVAGRIALPTEERVRRLTLVAAEVATCTRCVLSTSRTKPVFARGSVSASVVFVGEGPGHNEDQTGEPFVGAAGQLLDKMIAAMGLSPDEFYICNVVKCRPPENRTPLPDEAAACASYLRAQLETIGPKVVVALGRCAAENLGCALPGRTWRGIWGTHEGVPVMPTYHPAYLLRSPEMKRPVWEDLQKVMQRLGRPTKTP